MPVIARAPRQPESILIVDDEEGIREAIGEFLASKNYPCACSATAEEALQILNTRKFDLVITDMKMPGMDGITLSKEIKKISPDTSIVIITAHGNIHSALEAIGFGAEDYILKPFSLGAIEHTIVKVLEKKRLKRQNIDYQRELERKVSERSADITRASREIGQTFYKTIHIFGNALESRERYLYGRTERITLLAYHTATQLGWGRREMAQLLLGAPVSDVGKLSLPEPLLYKSEPLTDEERAVIRTHVGEGLHIISNIAHFREVSSIIHFHHERFDGTGYPLGLRGEAIPLQARLVAVCDSFDAMTHKRPWREAKAALAAMDELESQSGTGYDPAIVRAFLEVVEREQLDRFIGKKPTSQFYQTTMPILASPEAWPE